MPPTPTVRERLERWRDRHEEAVAYLLADGMEFDDPPVATSKGYCENCGKTWPCPDFEDAVAALAQLDGARETFPREAARALGDGTSAIAPHRLVPDAPLFGPSLAELFRDELFPPDPLVPRLDADPNTKEDA